MKVLFFNPEQYVDFLHEPSNYELRLPMLGCGAISEYKDFIYQRVIKQEGSEAMNKKALEIALDYKPDLLVYSTAWRMHIVDPKVLQKIMDNGIRIYTHVWDTHIYTDLFEHMWLSQCNYFGVADSISKYFYYSTLVKNSCLDKQVIYTGGNNIYTDIFRKRDLDKKYDVTILGSAEGMRLELIDFLQEKLPQDIVFAKKGGLVNSRKGPAEQGLTDDWVPMEQYVDIINQSKICVCSQTAPNRYQIKGKVFEFLACGALCFSDNNEELKKLVPNDCIVYYDSYQDCCDKIEYYLKNEDELNRIANNGYEWFKKTFNYKDFWNKFLTSIC